MKTVRWLSGLALAAAVAPAMAADQQERIIMQPTVDVRSGPSSAYYATSQLQKNERVVVNAVKNGWLEIKPPSDSFDWVSLKDIEVRGQLAIVLRETDLRRGSVVDPTRLDVAPNKLAPGAQVTLKNVPHARVGPEELVAISPPDNDFRYIPIEAISGGAPGGAGVKIPSIPGGDSAPLPSMPAPASDWGLNTGNAPSLPPAQGQSTQDTRQPIIPTQFTPPNDNGNGFGSGNANPSRGQPLQSRLPEASRSFAPPAQEPVPAPSYNGYASNPARTGQVSSPRTSLKQDPNWIAAEQLESQGNVAKAIEYYDAVGRTFGQTDPNLALHAMNRAQYLRNEISAGVVHPPAQSRSEKQDYTGTARSEVFPSYNGKPNEEYRQRAARKETSDVFPQPSNGYLPDVAKDGSRSTSNLVNNISQPTAKLTQPLKATEASNSKLQLIWYYPGKLARTQVGNDRGGVYYRLEPDGYPAQTLMYCTNAPGVSLDPYVGKHVQLYGSFGYNSKAKQYSMEVLEVRQLP